MLILHERSGPCSVSDFCANFSRPKDTFPVVYFVMKKIKCLCLCNVLNILKEYESLPLVNKKNSILQEETKQITRVPQK